MNHHCRPDRPFGRSVDPDRPLGFLGFLGAAARSKWKAWVDSASPWGLFLAFYRLRADGADVLIGAASAISQTRSAGMTARTKNEGRLSASKRRTQLFFRGGLPISRNTALRPTPPPGRSSGWE